MKKKLIGLVVLIIFSNSVYAQDQAKEATFCAFVDGNAEKMGGFQCAPVGKLSTEEPSGKTLFELMEPFKFVDPSGRVWVTPAGYKSDGASIPQLLKSFTGGSFDQRHVFAAIIHDYYSCMRVRTEFDTHVVYFDGLIAAGVSHVYARRQVLEVFRHGPHWFDPPASRVQEFDKFPGESCVYDEHQGEHGGNEHFDYLRPPSTLGRSEWPIKHKIAERKLIANNRILLATDGEFFDIDSEGNFIPATLREMFDDARRFNSLLETDAFLEDPASLGILATEQELELGAPSEFSTLPPGWDTLTDDFIANQLLQNGSIIEFDRENFQMLENNQIVQTDELGFLDLGVDEDTTRTILEMEGNSTRLNFFSPADREHRLVVQYPDDTQLEFDLNLQQGKTEFIIPPTQNLDPAMLKFGQPVQGQIEAIELAN